MSTLRWVTALGLVTHIIGTYLIIKFGDPFFRDHPMNWYPTSIYFCIALVCFYKMTNETRQTGRKEWGFLSALTLTTSIAIATNFFMIVLPDINTFIDPKLINEHFLLIYLIQLLTFTVPLLKNIEHTPITAIASLITIFALIWIDLSSENT